MHPYFREIGAHYKANNWALTAAAKATSTTRNGTAVSVVPYGSGTIVAFTGASSGTPTGVEVTYTLQSREAGGSWSTVKDRDNADVEITIEAADTATELDVDFGRLAEDHVDVRLVEAVTLTGGTSPTIITGAILVLGGSKNLPA